MFHVPNEYRVREGHYSSDDSYGNNGAFRIPLSFEFNGTMHRNKAVVIASDGEGWEHVSVSLAYRPPVWEEMCIVKGIFWDAEDCVVQYHPPKSTYVNFHPHALHLWRPTGVVLPVPPAWMVGPTKLS